MTVKDTGKKKLDKLTKELKRFQKLKIFIGYQDVKGTDLTVIDIASIQEFGTLPGTSPQIPARPFLSSAMDVNKEKIRDQFIVESNAIIEGKRSAIQAAERLGIFGVSLVKKRIIDSPAWAKQLSDVTIAIREARGTPSTKPLVDRGEMLNSVTYVVKEGDSVIASG